MLIKNFFLVFILLTLSTSAFASQSITPIISYLLSTPANYPPSANAGKDKSAVEKSGIVLTGTATDSDGTIVSYAWYEGTTFLSNAISFTYIPARVGTITLTFTATDNKGLSASDSMNLIVTPESQVNQAPLVDAGPDQWEYLTSHTPIVPTVSDEDGTIVRYEWREGDTILSHEKNLSYKPATASKHILTLSVTDDRGAVSSDTVSVIGIKELSEYITDKKIVSIPGYVRVAINSDHTIAANVLNDRGNTIVSYLWMEHNKHDVLSESRRMNYRSDSLGNKTINFIVNYADGKTYIVQFTLEALKPVLTVDAGKNLFAEHNKAVLITGSGSNTNGTSVNYTWTEGDTVLSNTASFNYTPPTIGNHTLKLTISSNTAEFDISDTIVVTATVAGETHAGKVVTDKDGNSYNVLESRLLYGRDDGKGIDLVIIGDGFVEDEMDRFRDRAQETANYMLNYDPKLSKHKNAWNIHIIDLASNQSGVDNEHAQNGVQVDTPLDGHFYCSDIQRLFCVDDNKVSFVSSQIVPQFQEVLIIGNSTIRGGSGGLYGAFTMSYHGKKTAVHELGHSLARLGDEYSNSGAYPYNYEPPVPNLTINNNPETVKWKHWMGEEIGLDSSGVMQTVGLYEGGSYAYTGIWRSSKNSFMSTSGHPMHPVNAEAWALAVYKDAGTFYSKTPTSQTPEQVQGSNTHFYLEPSMGAEAQKITWYVDDVLQNRSDSEFSFDFGASQITDYRVKAVIEDTTGAIRKDDKGYSSSTTIWNVNVK